MQLPLSLPQLPRVLEMSVTIPGMCFTVVTCLRMMGPCLKVLVLVVEGSSHPRKDEHRDAVCLADVGTEQGHTQGCLSPTLILCFLSFSLSDPLVSYRFYSSCCSLLPSQ